MSDEELLRYLLEICERQANPARRPYLCGNDTRHAPLVPLVVRPSREIALFCRDCGYSQPYAPTYVLVQRWDGTVRSIRTKPRHPLWNWLARFGKDTSR
jgi:hypothetical protein